MNSNNVYQKYHNSYFIIQSLWAYYIYLHYISGKRRATRRDCTMPITPRDAASVSSADPKRCRTLTEDANRDPFSRRRCRHSTSRCSSRSRHSRSRSRSLLSLRPTRRLSSAPALTSVRLVFWNSSTKKNVNKCI